MIYLTNFAFDIYTEKLQIVKTSRAFFDLDAVDFIRRTAPQTKILKAYLCMFLKLSILFWKQNKTKQNKTKTKIKKQKQKTKNKKQKTKTKKKPKKKTKQKNPIIMI